MLARAQRALASGARAPAEASLATQARRSLDASTHRPASSSFHPCPGQGRTPSPDVVPFTPADPTTWFLSPVGRRSAPPTPHNGGPWTAHQAQPHQDVTYRHVNHFTRGLRCLIVACVDVRIDPY